uniref:nitrilase-related carbon-nitrogen hydrolase n=1 Tax=Algoriphagus sp. TaxID=1872435 RepID=UPI004048C386
MDTLKIGGATVNQTPLDWQGNFERIIQGIQEARQQGIELLCFPELTLTGYGAEDLFLSPWFTEKSKQQLIKLLPYCQDITLAVGLPLRLDNKVYNTIAIIENGEIKGFVAKQFMAIDGVHYEFRWFTPWLAFQQTTVEINGKQVPFGDLTFELKGIHYGFEICEDAWRGEVRPGYRLCDRQVDLIFNPSASHFAMNKTLERKDLVTQSSSLFNCYYFYVNLLGNEAGRMIFDGEILLAKEGKLLGRNQLLSFESVQVRAFVLENKVQTIDPFHS